MSLPWRSSARALFNTSNAVSVPRRDIRWASFNSYCVEVSIVVGDIIISFQCGAGALARDRDWLCRLLDWPNISCGNAESGPRVPIHLDMVFADAQLPT